MYSSMLVRLLQYFVVSMLPIGSEEACRLIEPTTSTTTAPSITTEFLTTSEPSTSSQVEVEQEEFVEGTYLVSDKCTALIIDDNNNNSCACTLAKCYYSNIIDLCVKFALEACRLRWFHTNCQRRNVFYANTGDLCYNTDMEENCTKEIIRYADVELGKFETENNELVSRRLHITQTREGNEQCFKFESILVSGNYEACIKISKNEISRNINKIISFYVQDTLAVHSVDVSNLISLAMDNIEICAQFTVTIDKGQGQLLVPGFNVSTFKVPTNEPYFYFKLCNGECLVPENRRGRPYPVQLVVYRLIE